MGERTPDQIGEATDHSPPDIIEELRWQKRYTQGRIPYTMEKAAKEIERLRAKEISNERRERM